jgi:hypothetical protein
VTLSPTIEAMCAASLRKLYKAIDKRTQIAHGRHPNTASRSVGQLYRDRAAEAREAALRG